MQLTFFALAEEVKQGSPIPDSLYVKTLKSSQFSIKVGDNLMSCDFSNIYEMMSAVGVPEDQLIALGISESTKEEFYAL
jgi:hypothetical protein